MSATEALFWLVFVGGNIGALFRPLCGAVVYIVVYSLDPETQWWGQHVAALGLRTSFTTAVCTAIGMILNWRALPTHQKQFPWMYRFMLVFLAYCFIAGMSGLQQGGGVLGQHFLIKLAKVAIFVFLLLRLVRTLQDYRHLLWAWMAGVIYVGYEAWSGVGLSSSGRMLASGLGGPDFAQSSGLAAHLIAMLAIAGFLFYSSRTYRGKLFSLLAAAFAVNTIIMTRTRNAFPGAVVLIVFGLLRLPKGLRLKCAVGVLIGLLLALNLTDDAWWHRMETMKNPEDDSSITARLEYWGAAMQMVRENPLGVGPGQFRVLVQGYVQGLKIRRSAHSTYFECLAEMGYPGMLLFLGVIISAFMHFEQARRVGKQWLRYSTEAPELSKNLRELLLLATANEVAIAGFLTCAAFTTRLWTEGLWLLMSMSCCLYNITQQMRAQTLELSSANEPTALPDSNRPVGAANC